MGSDHIVINTIVFVEQIQHGARQVDFFQGLKRLGIQFVEVREEYFRGQKEMDDTGREAARLGLKLLYSVPKTLFREGKLDTDMIRTTAVEASLLGAVGIKWTRGDFSGWSEMDAAWMKSFVGVFHGLLTVENDQTQRDGTVEAHLAFLHECRERHIHIYTTFDVGNWLWVGEDPSVNAGLLKDFVRYIHVKDVVVRTDGPCAVPVGQGEIPIREVLAQLPAVCLIALEYPGGEQPMQVIQEGVNWF